MNVASFRKRAFVRAVLTQAHETGDTVSPWQRVDGVWSVFTDEGQLLQEIHQQWVNALEDRLNAGAEIAHGPDEVREVYGELQAELPDVRAILDSHSTSPELEESFLREYSNLAAVAGLGGGGLSDAQLAGLGRDLVSGRVPRQRVTSD